MYIDVIKGQELNVYISESLENPENMMFPVFKQALQALAGIVRQAREFDMYGQREGDFCKQERLFPASEVAAKPAPCYPFPRLCNGSERRGSGTMTRNSRAHGRSSKTFRSSCCRPWSLLSWRGNRASSLWCSLACTHMGSGSCGRRTREAVTRNGWNACSVT